MNGHTSMFPESRASEHIQSIGAALTPPHLDLVFQLIDSPRVNAYARGRVISITLGAYRLVGDKDGLAGLLGHEIAHLMLGARGPQSEYEADRLGVKLAAEAGFHPQGLRRFLVAFAQILANHPEAVAPSDLLVLQERIRRLS